MDELSDIELLSALYIKMAYLHFVEITILSSITMSGHSDEIPLYIKKY